MKAKDWQKAAQMVKERQNQMAILDTTELRSLSLSQLSTDQSGPPIVTHGIDARLSTSTPIQVFLQSTSYRSHTRGDFIQANTT